MRRPAIALFLTALVGTTLTGPAQASSPTGPADDDATAYLSVYLGGDGTGKVTSVPAGIDCGDGSFACTVELPIGTVVTLTATPNAISTFDGWASACTGVGTCVVTIEEDTEVRAFFDAYSLDVSLDGDGIGTVVSDPAGITCDDDTFDCWEPYAPGTVVSLTATTGANSVFLGWGGACTGTGTCVVTVNEDVDVSAAFDTAWLTVEPRGDGTGVATSTPAGIECGYESFPCKRNFQPGTVVTLSATAAADSAFTGWGSSCSGIGGCSVTLNTDKTVSVSFDTSYVYVKDEGDGEGVVTANVGDLSCPPTCLERYVPGTAVTLTATVEPASKFDGWDGHCDGSAPACALVLTSDKQVEATFDTGRTFAAVWGDGEGTVTSTPAGIVCPGDCTEYFHPDTEVTLVAEPTDGKTAFVGWIGDCSGTGPCVLDAAADPYAQAIFDSSTLTVDRVGLGAGTVTSEPAGIDCGEDCSEAFLPGGSVTLIAQAEAGSTFTGWLGACTGTGPCVLELEGDPEVTAQFNGAGVAGKIAYECNGDICVMNEDGTGNTNITNTSWSEYEPTLSPDATQIAFMVSDGLPDNPDRNLEIALINIDGTGLTQVTHSTGQFGDRWDNYDPDWSPDGTKIAFVTTRESNPVWRQIYSINVDGTDEIMLTDDADQATRTGPKWSPDGTKIAFTRSIGHSDVFVMDADGSNQVNVTADDGWWSDGGPAWSPDGTRLAYTTTRWYEELTHNTDIMVIQADGTGLARATDVMAIDEDPTWSPDGEWIAFSSPRIGGYDIWAVKAPPPGGHADGIVEEELKRLTTAPTSDLDPYWSGNDTSQFTHRLTVKKAGNGKGVVRSAPAGIKCGRDCTDVFTAGTRVVLTAAAAKGSMVAGWNVPCLASSTTATCVLSVEEATTVKVRFERTPTTSPPRRPAPA